MKRILLLVGALCLALYTGGVGHGAGDLLPILSASISQESGNQLTLTAEAVRQDSLEGNAASVYLTASGTSTEQLLSEIEQMLAGQLYLSHARTIVIDETVARNGFSSLVQTLLKRSDVRLTLRIAVARGVPADAIVKAQAVAEEIPGAALGALMDAHAKHGGLPDLPLCRTADSLLSGQDFCLPALTLTADGRVIPAGRAQFHQGQFVRFSGGEENAR